MKSEQELYSNFNKTWVIGFTDGEGCFNLDVHVLGSMRWKLQMQPEFTIVQHERDKPLLEDFIIFFGCGNVGVNKKDSTSTRYHFRVKNIKDLQEKVIPFFEQNPLLTKKSNDFTLFKQIVSLMYNKQHLVSLKDFLHVVKLGEELSNRSSTREKAPGKVKKREAVNKIVQTLYTKLQENP
jgi:LAGLIDADG endonuclease